MTTETKSPLSAPRKIVTYPLGEDPNGGAVFLYGKPDSSNVAIFCAGFPDDHENGQVFCSRLAEENDTLVGLTCLPGYDNRPDKKWQTHKAAGYTFDEMTNAIRDAVKVVRAESTTKSAKLTGIFHDWGVVPGLMWANRSLKDVTVNSPSKIVLFDVLGDVHPDLRKDLPKFENPSFFDTFTTWYYRVLFASAFALQKYVSKYLALACFTFGMLPMQIFPIGPLLDIDSKVTANRQNAIDPFHLIYMAYPYLDMIKMAFKGGLGAVEDYGLPKDLKNLPVLYLYGTEKRVMFHDKRSVYFLEREAKEKRSKSNAIAIEGAGHWLHVQKPDICLNEVKKFMSE